MVGNTAKWSGTVIKRSGTLPIWSKILPGVPGNDLDLGRVPYQFSVQNIVRISKGT